MALISYFSKVTHFISQNPPSVSSGLSCSGFSLKGPEGCSGRLGEGAGGVGMGPKQLSKNCNFTGQPVLPLKFQNATVYRGQELGPKKW